MALVTVLLCVGLERQNRDFSALLTLAASGLIGLTALTFLEPVLDFLRRLEQIGDLGNSYLLTLLKILGVGLTGEISAAVCNDAGNSSLGKGLRFLTNMAILYLSIPVFTSLIDLIQQILRDT